MRSIGRRYVCLAYAVAVPTHAGHEEEEEEEEEAQRRKERVRVVSEHVVSAEKDGDEEEKGREKVNPIRSLPSCGLYACCAWRMRSAESTTYINSTVSRTPLGDAVQRAASYRSINGPGPTVGILSRHAALTHAPACVAG